MGTVVLIKFGQRTHMEQLFREGVVYMDTLASHRRREADKERHDPYEGVERIMQMKGAKLKKKNSVTDEFNEIATLTGGVGCIRNRNLDKLNVFCLSHFIVPEDKGIKFGEVVGENVLNGFGDTAVVIYDSKSFVTRVKETAIEQGYRHMRGLVKYEDLSIHHGEVGPFVKDLRFCHQQELRILIFDPKSEPGPLYLRIGNLEDIAFLIPANDINLLTIECE